MEPKDVNGQIFDDLWAEFKKLENQLNNSMLHLVKKYQDGNIPVFLLALLSTYIQKCIDQNLSMNPGGKADFDDMLQEAKELIEETGINFELAFKDKAI